jgi:hypothetical protein
VSGSQQDNCASLRTASASAMIQLVGRSLGLSESGSIPGFRSKPEGSGYWSDGDRSPETSEG